MSTGIQCTLYAIVSWIWNLTPSEVENKFQLKWFVDTHVFFYPFSLCTSVMVSSFISLHTHQFLLAFNQCVYILGLLVQLILQLTVHFPLFLPLFCFQFRLSVCLFFTQLFLTLAHWGALLFGDLGEYLCSLTVAFLRLDKLYSVYFVDYPSVYKAK